MYFKEEEVKEEVKDENATKENEYFKRKKNKRQFYRGKQQLILESSNIENSNETSKRGVKYLGQVCNLGVTENDNSKY